MNKLFPVLPFCVCMFAPVHVCGECVRTHVCAQYLLFPSHLAGGPPWELLTVTARQVLWDPSPGLQGGGPVTRPRVPLKCGLPEGPGLKPGPSGSLWKFPYRSEFTTCREDSRAPAGCRRVGSRGQRGGHRGLPALLGPWVRLPSRLREPRWASSGWVSALI